MLLSMSYLKKKKKSLISLEKNLINNLKHVGFAVAHFTTTSLLLIYLSTSVVVPSG